MLHAQIFFAGLKPRQLSWCATQLLVQLAWADKIVTGIANPGTACRECDIAGLLDRIKYKRYAHCRNCSKAQSYNKDFHGGFSPNVCLRDLWTRSAHGKRRSFEFFRTQLRSGSR